MPVKGHQSASDWKYVIFLAIENTPQIVTESFGIHFRIFQLQEKLNTSSLEVNPLQSKITDCNSRPLLGRRNWSNQGPFTAAVEQLDVKPQTHVIHCHSISILRNAPVFGFHAIFGSHSQRPAVPLLVAKSCKTSRAKCWSHGRSCNHSASKGWSGFWCWRSWSNCNLHVLWGFLTVSQKHSLQENVELVAWIFRRVHLPPKEKDQQLMTKDEIH